MGRAREFEPHDIPAVARLWQQTFRHTEQPAPESLLKYFETVFFRGPWRDDGLPSWVYENQGRVVGFLGVLPRRMLFQGEPIRTGVITQLMVEAHAGAGIAALDMMKRYFNGPQELCWTDGANDSAEKLWTRLGGEVAYLYSQEWRRVLRPARFLTGLLRKKRPLHLLGQMARPVCWSVDALAARLPVGPYRRKAVTLAGEEATAEALLDCYRACYHRRALVPDYDADWLAWALDMVRQTTGHGSLRKIVLRNQQGEPVGWYLYFVRPGGEGKVLQVGAKEGSAAAVLDHLFEDAREQGAAAVSGQMEPRLQRELSDHHCRFRCLSLGVLLHSRNKELLHAIQRGDAALTRLEGEWWLRFGSDDFTQPPAPPVAEQAFARSAPPAGQVRRPAPQEMSVLEVTPVQK